MTAQFFNEVNCLPEGVSSETLAAYFARLISESCSPDSQIEFDVLASLAEKQWHTYEKIDVSIAKGVADWVRDNVNLNSLSHVESALMIASCLGIFDIVSFLAGATEEIQNDAVKLEIVDFISREGGDVENPYSGMTD